MRYYLMIVVIGLYACGKEFDISGSYDVVVPNLSAFSDGSSNTMNFDFRLEYTAEEKLEGKDTSKIKSIKLSYASLTVKEPINQTLDFLNNIQVFLDLEDQGLIIFGDNFIGVTYKELAVEDLDIKKYIINYPTEIYITGDGVWPPESVTVTIDFSAVVKVGL